MDIWNEVVPVLVLGFVIWWLYNKYVKKAKK